MFLIPIIIFYYILIYSIHNNSYAKKNSYVKKKNSLPPEFEPTTHRNSRHLLPHETTGPDNFHK